MQVDGEGHLWEPLTPTKTSPWEEEYSQRSGGRSQAGMLLIVQTHSVDERSCFFGLVGFLQVPFVLQPHQQSLSLSH